MKITVSRSARFLLLGILPALLIGTTVGGLDRVTIVASAKSLAVVLAAALLHELGHMVAAHLTGTPLGELRLDLFGARMSLHGMLSYRREACIAAAGPAVNLLSAAMLLLCCPELGELLRIGGEASPLVHFTVASLGLAAINLVPVRTLDGGRILHCVLAALIGDRVADGVLAVTTALCLGSLWLFSVYALLRVGEMLTLFAFSLCLLSRLLARD